MIEADRRPRRLSRKERTLVALGVAVWVALGSGGVWFVHQLTRPPASCGGAAEAETHQAKGATGSPRNALQLLTGTGRCQ